MIRRINYPKHPSILQVYHACLTCLKRFHSVDILQLLFSSQRETITICSCSCHPITSVSFCPLDLLIIGAGEGLSETLGTDFGGNVQSFPELTQSKPKPEHESHCGQQSRVWNSSLNHQFIKIQAQKWRLPLLEEKKSDHPLRCLVFGRRLVGFDGYHSTGEVQ